jgi:hypothetical protein
MKGIKKDKLAKMIMEFDSWKIMRGYVWRGRQGMDRSDETEITGGKTEDGNLTLEPHNRARGDLVCGAVE